jgi:hypothetical protein
VGFRQRPRSRRPPHHGTAGPHPVPPFHLIASADGSGIAIAYRPTLLIDALWQQFAREAAGILHCTRCPAPNCGRWFLRSAGRSDRQYCSPACRMRAWRTEPHRE